MGIHKFQDSNEVVCRLVVGSLTLFLLVPKEKVMSVLGAINHLEKLDSFFVAMPLIDVSSDMRSDKIVRESTIFDC